jgi:hypothetical protein
MIGLIAVSTVKALLTSRNREPMRTPPPSSFLSITPIIISLISLVISVGSFVYTIRTYTITHRPYIGITEVKNAFDTGAQGVIERITWKIVMKNTGSLPGWMRVVKREVTVTQDGEIFPVPLKQAEPEAGILLMPGGDETLEGDYPANEVVPIHSVLTGRAILRDTLRVVYEPTSAAWWNPQYYYEATVRLIPSGRTAFFMMTVGKAD